MPPGHVRFPQALGRSQEAAAAFEPALTSMIDDVEHEVGMAWLSRPG
ncbi:MAG: hypothetical protein R6W79_10005 [Acidimicrobiia bacterium]